MKYETVQMQTALPADSQTGVQPQLNLAGEGVFNPCLGKEKAWKNLVSKVAFKVL